MEDHAKTLVATGDIDSIITLVLAAVGQGLLPEDCDLRRIDGNRNYSFRVLFVEIISPTSTGDQADLRRYTFEKDCSPVLKLGQLAAQHWSESGSATFPRVHVIRPGTVARPLSLNSTLHEASLRSYDTLRISTARLTEEEIDQLMLLAIEEGLAERERRRLLFRRIPSTLTGLPLFTRERDQLLSDLMILNQMEMLPGINFPAICTWLDAARTLSNGTNARAHFRSLVERLRWSAVWSFAE